MIVWCQLSIANPNCGAGDCAQLAMSRSLVPRSDTQIEKMRARFDTLHPWAPPESLRWDEHSGVGKLCSIANRFGVAESQK